MKKRTKWIIAIASIVLVGAAIMGAKLKALPVELTTVAKSDVLSTVTEKGKLVNSDKIEIYNELQSKVLNNYKDIGDIVQKGELIAELDTKDISSQLAQIQGELKSVKGAQAAAQSTIDYNQVKQQEAAVEQAKIAVKYADEAYQRLQKLFSEGAVTTVEVDQAKADLETKQKVLDQAQAGLKQIQANLNEQSRQKQGVKQQYEGQRESLEARASYLKEQLAKGKIFAPEAGTILEKNIDKGDFVTPGMLLYTIGGTGKSSVETYVSSKDLVNIKINDEVKIVFKTAGEDVDIKGRISKIAPVAEERASALGILEDKIKVNVVFDNFPNNIRLIPGITTDVVFITQRVNGAIAIPKDAIFSDLGKDYVWVVADGKASTLEIQKGIEGDELVEVRKGLVEGDKILLNPHQKELKQGIKVKEISAQGKV